MTATKQAEKEGEGASFLVVLSLSYFVKWMADLQENELTYTLSCLAANNSKKILNNKDLYILSNEVLSPEK